MRWTRVVGVVAATQWLVGVAAAHEVTGGRLDAPLPLPFLFAGAGATVAGTAWLLGRTDRTADVAASVATRPFDLPRPRFGRWFLRAVGLAGFAGVLWFGIVGTRAAADNPATLFAWAVALKGVAVVSVVVGSPWRAISPWRTLYAAFVALEGDEIAALNYPDWLGVWPAVAGFVALVGVVENLTEIPQSPRLTAGVLAAYAAAMVLGALVFGRSFFEHGDALEVFYGLLGRVSPVEWREHELALRAPWVGCARFPAAPGVPAFVVAAVYTVSFDGFSNAPEYQTVYFAVRDLAGVYTPLVLYFVGLTGFLAAYGAVAVLTERVSGGGGSGGSGGGDGGDDGEGGGGGDGGDDGEGGGGGSGDGFDTRGAAAAFAPTVVPIVAAYEIAHNYPFVARNLSALLSLQDGVSVSLLGWLPLAAFWWSQVALVVTGHVLAVVAAHRVAARRYGSRAGRAHVPLVALMVGYTVLSLWIISRPVVA